MFFTLLFFCAKCVIIFVLRTQMDNTYLLHLRKYSLEVNFFERKQTVTNFILEWLHLLGCAGTELL